jgi:hypothetical protein
MAYEKQDGDFIIFDNRESNQNPKAPDFKGSVVLNGIDYEIAAWENRNGGWRGSIKPKEERFPR